MKKIILLFISVIFLLVSCNGNEGIGVQTSESINKIKVEKLFVVDGITVYRFHDGGRVVYFTNKKGETFTFNASRAKVMELVERFSAHQDKYLYNKGLVVAHFHRMARAWYRATHLSKNMV